MPSEYSSARSAIVSSCLAFKSAAGNLDALHPRRVPHRIRALGQLARGIGHLLNFLPVVPLAVVVTLAVGSAAKPRLGEQALVELALLAQRDFRLEDVDFARQSFRHLAGKLFGPV